MSSINNNTFNNFQATTSVAKEKQTNNEHILYFNGHSLIKTVNIATPHTTNNLNIKKNHLASNECCPQAYHKVTILDRKNPRLKCISTGCFFAISETEYELEKKQANNIIDGPDMHISQYPCPYLATQFKGQASKELLNEDSLKKISDLIYKAMLQQDIIFKPYPETIRKNNNIYLNFFPAQQSIKYLLPEGVIYNITSYTKNCIKASAAITELWKEVETDKLIIKLKMLYPNTSDKDSKTYIKTWSIKDGTTYCIIKNNDTTHEVPVDNFLDINQLSINFDHLRDDLTKEGVSYEKLFQPAKKTLKSKLCKPKYNVPSGILYTNMFTIFY
jgi:hypothetical protein